MAAPAQIISSIQIWSILQQTRGTKTSHHLWCLLGGSTTSILWVSWHSCQRQEMHAGFKKLLYHSKFGGCNLYWKTHWCQEYQAAFLWKMLTTYLHSGCHCIIMVCYTPLKLQFTASDMIPEYISELFAFPATWKILKTHPEHALYWKLLRTVHVHWGNLEYCFGDKHFVRQRFTMVEAVAVNSHLIHRHQSPFQKADPVH